MDLPEDSIALLSSICIGELRGKHKALAEKLIVGFREEHRISLDGRDSIFALVKYSKKLNARDKKDRELLKKTEELIMLCRGLAHGKAPAAAERQEKQEQKPSFGSRRGVKMDRLSGEGAHAPTAHQAAKGILYEGKKRGLVIRRVTSDMMSEPAKRGQMLTLFQSTMDAASAKKMEGSFSEYAAGKAKGGLLDLEYYVLEINGKPVGFSGIYTVRSQTPGFGDEKGGQFVVARLGWLGLSKDYRGGGLGKLMVEIAETRACNLGADIFAIETSDNPLYDSANGLYRRMGYRSGVDQKNYFGEGRDLHTFYAAPGSLKLKTESDYSLQKARPEDADEIRELSKRVFGAETEEFKRVLNLYLSQAPEQGSSTHLDMFVLRKEGKAVGIATATAYRWAAADVWWSRWHGAAKGNEEALIAHLDKEAGNSGKRMLVLETSSAAESSRLRAAGFSSSEAIPNLYCTEADWKKMAKKELESGDVTKVQYEAAILNPLNFIFYAKPVSRRAQEAWGKS